MPDKFKKLTIKIPVEIYQKLKLIAETNNKTVVDTAVEMIYKNINKAEKEQRKEIVLDMLESSGGVLIEGK